MPAVFTAVVSVPRVLWRGLRVQHRGTLDMHEVREHRQDVSNSRWGPTSMNAEVNASTFAHDQPNRPRLVRRGVAPDC